MAGIQKVKSLLMSRNGFGIEAFILNIKFCNKFQKMNKLDLN